MPINLRTLNWFGVIQSDLQFFRFGLFGLFCDWRFAPTAWMCSWQAQLEWEQAI